MTVGFGLARLPRATYISVVCIQEIKIIRLRQRVKECGRKRHRFFDKSKKVEEAKGGEKESEDTPQTLQTGSNRQGVDEKRDGMSLPWKM